MSKAFPRSRSPISMPPAELGYRVKLLGVAVKTEAGIEQRVHPTMVPKDSAIAQVMGVTNAVTVDAEGLGADHAGGSRRRRHGDGVGDGRRSCRYCARRAHPPFGRPAARMTAIRKAPMQHHEGGYYIRLLARDRPGTAATIARRLAQQKISLESIVQRHEPARAGRRAARPFRRAGAGHHDHLCDQRGCGPQGAGRRAPRPGDLRPAASDPDREKLARSDGAPANCMEIDHGVDNRSAQSHARAHSVARDRAGDRTRRGRRGAAARARRRKGIRSGRGRRHAARARASCRSTAPW